MTLMKLLAPVCVLGAIMIAGCAQQQQTTTTDTETTTTLSTVASGRRFKAVRKRYPGEGVAVVSSVDMGTAPHATGMTHAKLARRAESAAKYACDEAAQKQALEAAAQTVTCYQQGPNGPIACKPGQGAAGNIHKCRLIDAKAQN